MIFNLKRDHTLITNDKVLGVDEENRSETIHVNIEDSTLFDKWVYIEFRLENGDEFLTPRLDIENGAINYEVPNSIMVGGYIKLQIVFRDSTNWIWKSFIKQVLVRNSLNVGDEVAKENPDFITEAQKVLDDVEQAVIDVDKKVDKTTKINNYTLDKDVNLIAEDVGAYSKEEMDQNKITNAEIDALFE